MIRKLYTIVFCLITFVCVLSYPVLATTYTYDNLNRLTKLEYSNGKIITYTYDAGGNITDVASVNANAVSVNVVDNHVSMNSANTAVIANDNSWSIGISNGTVKELISTDNLIINNLPSGLNLAATKGEGNTIVITVSGNLQNPITAPTTVSIVVKASAVTETGINDSSPVNVLINPCVNKVSAVCSDDTITVNSDNRTVAANDDWLINLSNGTIKTDFSANDLTITNLPSGLLSTASKVLNQNSIRINLSGSATIAVSPPVNLNVIIKGTAVTESGLGDSEPIPVKLNGTGNQVVLEVTDAIVSLANGNQSVSSEDNSWLLKVSGVTLKTNLTNDDLIITGLPNGLNAVIAKQGDDSIKITVNGTATNQVVTINVTALIKASAFTEANASNTNQVSLTIKSVSDCFIATAAFGSYLDPHVFALRQFRDNVMANSDAGRWFIAEYYMYSPPIAAYISDNASARVISRVILTPLVFAIEYPVGTCVVFLCGMFLLFVLANMERNNKLYKNL